MVLLPVVAARADSGEDPLPNLQRQDFWALAALTIIALIFRLIRLFDLDYNFDEIVLLFLAQGTFTEIWNQCKLDNFTPLFPWLVKLWTTVSTDLNWFRLFGALFGALTPPAAYWLGRNLLNRKLGWWLGLSCAISISLIFYSQFVRMFNLQPLLMILSLLWFIAALRTNRWKYWVLTAGANLVGFYLFYFMILVVIAQFVTLAIWYRFEWKKYFRPLLAHLIFILGLLIWLLPLWIRFSQVQQDYWIPEFSTADLVKLWMFLGTGADFRDRYLLAFILNVPFLIGAFVGLRRGWQDPAWRSVVLVFVITVACILMLSLWGQSFFFKRYFVFLVPVYLALALWGWCSIPKALWRWVGLVWISIGLGGSIIYYYVDYYQMHDYYGFVRPIPFAQAGEGHSLSRAASEVAQRLQDEEAIIHYSSPSWRVCTFFASVYYHQRELPEYIYSRNDLPQYNGRQYLRPGERIRYLTDLNPLPEGLWTISLELSEAILTEAHAREGIKPDYWLSNENLPAELDQANYKKVESFQFGKVLLVHFRRVTGTEQQL